MLHLAVITAFIAMACSHRAIVRHFPMPEDL